MTSKGKFFLGTDSAPHPLSSKKGPGSTPAGVFTQPHAVAYVVTAFEEAAARGDIPADAVTQDLLQGFLGGYGRKFYGVPDVTGERIRVRRAEEGDKEAMTSIKGEEGLEVVPFMMGQGKQWLVEWVS